MFYLYLIWYIQLFYKAIMFHMKNQKITHMELLYIIETHNLKMILKMIPKIT